MREERKVARMGDMINVYKCLIENYEGIYRLV
jgi:hypothetical protein